MNASDEEAKAYLRRLVDEPLFAAQELITLKTKQGKAEKYKPWPSQVKFEQLSTRFNLCIKVRQQGFSVGRLARKVVDARLQENRGARIFNFADDETTTLFSHVRFMDSHLPKWLKSEKYHDASKMIHYKDTNSWIDIQTAGKTMAQAVSKGRSATVHDLHVTEAGYIDFLADLLQGALGSVPDNGTITLESTSSGPRGYFSQRFITVMQKGKQIDPDIWQMDDHTAFFFGLLTHPEYRRACPKNWQPESEEEERLLKLGADPETVMWRRWKLRDYGEHEDNTGMSPEKRFKREFPATIHDALEEAGGMYFNPKVMVLIRDFTKHQWPEPVDMGLLKAASSEVMPTPPTADNRYLVWSPPAQGWRNRYVLFGDCAQGTENGDWDVGYVGDLVTREVVSAYRGKLGAELHCKFMLLLGAWYNNALIAWDCTGIGAELRPLLINSLYPNLWTRYDIAPGRAKTTGMLHAEPQALGMIWSKATKSEALVRVRQALENREWTIAHDQFYKEVEYFGFKDGDAVNPEAAEGFHDDCVMAMAGLMYVTDRCGSPVKDVKAGSFEKLNKNTVSLKKVLEEHRRQQHQEQWSEFSM